mgnify:CR=1 FL=1
MNKEKSLGMGGNLAQVYGIAKPMPASDFSVWIKPQARYLLVIPVAQKCLRITIKYLPAKEADNTTIKSEEFNFLLCVTYYYFKEFAFIVHP